ncbi:MAG: SMI1/KNR4 family protein [Phycisphaerae bacterium]|jgi:hypothetical protein
MIHESHIDQSINELMAKFGPRLRVRPPASAAELAELESVALHVPRALIIFLSTCNGFRLATDGASGPFQLWGTNEILQSLRGDAGPGLIPVRGEPEGERDWVVAAAGPLQDAVVRWNPCAPGAELLASSFDVYVQAYAAHLVECAGESRPRKRTPPRAFDAEHVRSFDPQVRKLAARRDVRAWLHELDLQVATGDDFE